MDVLMIGFNVTLLRALDSEEPLSYHITVIEEPDLYENKQLQKYTFSCLRNVILAEYQQSTSYLQVIEGLQGEAQFVAVIPGLEYAVEAANQAANVLGLPNAGSIAPAILTNKYLLREHGKKHGIPQPRFTKIESLQDASDFYQGSPIVLKPANRQASLGVVKVQASHQIADSWQEVLMADEGHHVANRAMKWEYLAEDCMEGFEISSEVLVSNGEMLFFNCTGKETTTGRYSVELGHLVPALLTEPVEQEVRHLMKKLINSLEFKYGVLHAEWMITQEGPKLIECAGRALGDMIFPLIGYSYGFNPYTALVDVLSGKTPTFPQRACSGSYIHFFTSEPGQVTRIDGVEALDHPQVTSWSLIIKVGDEVNPVKSSWNRCGNFIVKGENAQKAREKAMELAKMVIIETKSLAE